MRQIPFPWADPTTRDERSPVVLASETTKTLVALMARALDAVVRAAKETSDER